MKGFVKFLVLAIAGFGLGAGAAWLQQPPRSQDTHQFPSAKMSKASPAAETVAPRLPAPNPKDDGVVSPSAREGDLTAPEDKPAAEDKNLTEDKPAPEAADATGKTAGAATSAATTTAPATAPGTADKEPVSPEVAKNLAAAKGDVPTADAEIGGTFSLTDHDGNKVTEKSWPGKYLLVFFGFTNCPDVCPVTLDKLTSALDQLGDDAAKVQPLFITIDPFRDKPHVLKDYVSHFHKSILGLTGTDDQIKAVEDAYKIYSSRHDQPNGHDYSFDHSAFVYFMAPDGKMAEVIKIDDKASEIADRLRPWLEGKKQAETPTP